MKKLIFVGLLFIALVSLTGCAHLSEQETNHVYGFWGGVWHGMIAQFAFVGSLFNGDITIYAVNNNGPWYNFGYVGGLGIIIRFVGSAFKAIFGTSK